MVSSGNDAVGQRVTEGLSVRAAALAAPSRLALITTQGAWTFAELSGLVTAERRRLQEAGVDHRRPLAWVGGHDLKSLVRLYAAIEGGIPLAMLHRRATAEEHAHWIDAWQAQVVPEVDLPVGEGRRRQEDPEAALDPAADLAIVRTSGTGGEPKGVRLSRRAFVASADASAANLGWRDDDRWLLALPPSHVGGLSILLRCLLARRPVVIDDADHFDAEAMVRCIESRRVTLLSVVPTMLRRLVAVRGTAPSSLRAVLVGGGAASADLMSGAVKRRWPVLATYGCTEACSQITTQEVNTAWQARLGSGRPLPGQQVRIRDGRIEFRGATSMSGFLPAGDEPWTADGWLRSGDLGHLDGDGNLHVHGRADDVIISGGENVSPLRVEATLERHPAVEAACVFGIADATWGQRVAAAVVLRPNAEKPSPEGWDGFLRQHLAPYERPRQVTYVDALPLNGVGKLDRRAAAEVLKSEGDPRD